MRCKRCKRTYLHGHYGDWKPFVSPSRKQKELMQSPEEIRRTIHEEIMRSRPPRRFFFPPVIRAGV